MGWVTPKQGTRAGRRRELVGLAATLLLGLGLVDAAVAQAPSQAPSATPPGAVLSLPEADLQIRGPVNDVPASKPGRSTTPPAPGLSSTSPPSGKSAAPATPAGEAAQARITCSAQIADDGQPIEQGLIWRVYEDVAGKTALVTTSRESSPSFRLKPGAYVVNVAFGRANLTRKIVAKPGAAANEAFVLNAGGLKLEALIDKGQKPPPNTVAYDILTDERDQSGNRTRIMTGARPGLTVRLNAGIYHVVSVYGDANAAIETDVTVEAGKLTLARVTHQAARVTFKLVARAGGDALADTQWLLMTPQGEHVKESVGALPSHIIAPGNYTIVARQGGKAFRRTFAVQGGDVAQVEVVMQ